MKKNNRFIAQFGIAVFIALSTASCGLLQKDTYEYHIEVPDVYTLQDSLSSTDSTNIALIQWEDFFNDEQLTILIQKGLEHNFDMKKALANIEIAQLKANQAKLNWLPSVDANIANLAYQYRSENFYSNPGSNWYEHTGQEPPKSLYTFTKQHNSGLLVSWEIDVWGKFRDQKEMALNEYLETEEARKVIQTELITKIAEGYYNLILLYAQLEVAQTNFKLSKNTLDIVQLQYEAGQITALAKQQTKAQMLTAKALIPSLEQQIALQENQLNFLVGSFPKTIDISSKKLENYFYQDALTEGVPLQLLSNRPDIRAAELDLLSANAYVGVTQKQRYPSLKIDLGGGVNSMLPENWFNIPGSLFGSVIGGVTAPVFNKKRLKTDYEVALKERDKTEISLQQNVHKAITEVTDALVILKTIEEQLDIAEEQVANSSLAVRQSNLLFNSGFATYLEVINAQRSALENELSLNSIRKNKLVARIRLYKTLGGGWQ
ncbi:MAG TPA: efflux transporter outer membrane subunit [Flavobacterium sp.]|nr:efflux transporter outer membrane subunit [Flavobacterium sp.]